MIEEPKCKKPECGGVVNVVAGSFEGSEALCLLCHGEHVVVLADPLNVESVVWWGRLKSVGGNSWEDLGHLGDFDDPSEAAEEFADNCDDLEPPFVVEVADLTGKITAWRIRASIVLRASEDLT